MGLASSSVSVHLLRGMLGLVAAVAAVAGTALISPLALLLLTGTVVAWRGCPTCWAVGLAMTIAGRDGERCASRRCATRRS
jgi:hypothetical protein